MANRKIFLEELEFINAVGDDSQIGGAGCRFIGRVMIRQDVRVDRLLEEFSCFAFHLVL